MRLRWVFLSKLHPLLNEVAVVIAFFVSVVCLFGSVTRRSEHEAKQITGTTPFKASSSLYK